MGNKGISSIKSMLNALKSNNLDFELNWSSHHNKNHYWMGNAQKIENALNFLNDLEMQEPFICEISGSIQSLDKSGKINIIDNDKKTYRIRLEKSVLSEIEKLRINQYVTLKVTKHISNHPTFEKIIENYDFIEII
jgi:arabinogalactan endo-1,4-beta-galactosidase